MSTYMTETIECPADGCAWTLTPDRPEVPSGALASVFGAGTMAGVALYQHHHKVEAALREHFRTHELPEFLATITRLKGEVANAQADLTDLRQVADKWNKYSDDVVDQLRARVAELEQCLVETGDKYSQSLGRECTALCKDVEEDRDRMLPVVEAAKTWAHWYSHGRYGMPDSVKRRKYGEAITALDAAVDALDAPAGHEDKASEVTGG